MVAKSTIDAALDRAGGSSRRPPRVLSVAASVLGVSSRWTAAASGSSLTGTCPTL